MLTVTCLFVQGEYPYTVEYVQRLKAMVTRWIDRPFRFCCLTDRPWDIPADIESIPVTKLAGFAYWTKLQLFNPARNWTGRMLYFDLDVLIVAPLADLLDSQAPFVITDDPALPIHKFRTVDRHGRKILRGFNSSVMAWDGGTQTDLYTMFTPSVAERLSGDQDWIRERMPGAETWPREFFPRLSEAIEPPWPDDAKVVLCKVPKNHIAASRWTWFEPLWGAA